MDASPLASTVLFHIGPVPITRPVATTWAIILGLTLASWLVTRRLNVRPNRQQAVLEVIVTGILRQIEDIVRRDGRALLPLLGTLFIFLVVATGRVMGTGPMWNRTVLASGEASISRRSQRSAGRSSGPVGILERRREALSRQAGPRTRERGSHPPRGRV